RILSGSDVITGINYFLLLLIWVVGVANAVYIDNRWLLAVFSIDTHFFAGLTPIYDEEITQWPLVEIDEEWGCILKKVRDSKNLDLSLFTDKDAVITPEKAWNLFTSLWPGSPIKSQLRLPV
ncbi:MAG: hypothetical protein JXB88_19065, partial [Spirochaetales bacterium]|nr:hypothetical protein [Spirochaetales bacterium]